MPYRLAGREGTLWPSCLDCTLPLVPIVALKAATVLPILLLQKRSKTKDHTICLRRRLARWSKVELVREGRVIQERLPKPGPSTTNDNLAQNFAKLMFTGKCTAALDLLTIDTNSSNSPTVRDVLISKHPIGQPAHNSCIVLSDPEDPHPVIFESIDADITPASSYYYMPLSLCSENIYSD